jgi:transcriptional regulator with XRE-family HTH domain
MHTRLTIPERLKDLRVAEKRMSLQELSDAIGIPSSTLGNYEKDENVDMSLGNLLTLADFYQVSTDYLLCRTELREHTNKSVSDLHLNDDAVQILTDEKYNPRLLSELLSHESFHKFMTDLEIYIDGFNDKGIQIANAFLDVMRYKLNELGADSTDAFTSPTQIATEDTPEASNDAYINGLLLLFCKNLEMKITQLSVEEKQTLKEIFSRSKPAKEHRKLRRRNPKL